MFLSNARIEHQNGIHFYEQDILMNDRIYSGDLMMEMTIDYFAPGAGVVVVEENPNVSGRPRNTYLFKIGLYDFSVIRKTETSENTLLHTSNAISPPQTNLQLTFIKSGRSVEVLSRGRTVGHFMLPDYVERYWIGLYSNAGNVFKELSIATGVPHGWVVNIRNTGGGRVHFFKDGFTIEECAQDAEVEQWTIPLDAGKYYLDYDQEGDIQSYLYLSDDSRFNDDEKNLLDENRFFVLEENALVNVKFKGTSGTVKNISIKENIYESYVPTDKNPVSNEGSVMIVHLDGLKEVWWTGCITAVPQYEDLHDERKYGVITTHKKRYYPEDFRIELGVDYQYVYDVHNQTLRIQKAGQEDEGRSFSVELSPEDENKLFVFDNITAVIYDIIIVLENGERIDVIRQKTGKVYVPASIGGPIIVATPDHVPLDLSASYRLDGSRYRFTNWEREIFVPAEEIKLEKLPIDAAGSVRVYGVFKEAKPDINDLYRIENGIDTIDCYTPLYEIVTEDRYEVDYVTGRITFQKDLLDRYKEIVVDYLKNNSYCINYDSSLNAYEIDVSSEHQSVYIIYDYQGKSEGQGVVSEFLITDIQADLKPKYVVLRRI